MKFSAGTAFTSAAVLATGVLSSCQEISGNYYCNEVEQIVYKNIGFSGSYNKVTSFNSDGTCSSTSQSFSGNMSPLDEELSIHFRGPVAIKQVAVYGSSGSTNAKRAAEPEAEAEIPVNIGARHGHHVHKRAYVTAYDYVTQTVVIGSDGVQSTAYETVVANPAAASSSSSADATVKANNYALAEVSGQVVPDYQTIETSASVSTITGVTPSSSSVAVAASSSSSSSTASAASSAASASSSSSSSSGSGWSRSAYYNAESGSASGLTFFNNLGGSGSGVFDYTFGNSISYAGSDGVSCASSSEVLNDITLPSDKEIIIMSSDECSGDDCGYYRPGIPAYHGFDGATKMFLFEFGMPTATSGDSYNYDMPAIWFLNAQIPRTLQYGASSCSCWSTGCGELDVFEVLNAGNSYLTNHLHDEQGTNTQYGGGGSSDYFARPTSGTMKAAVIFDGDAKTITITKLDDSVSFDSSVSESTVQGWISATSSSSSTVSIAS